MEFMAQTPGQRCWYMSVYRMGGWMKRVCGREREREK